MFKNRSVVVAVVLCACLLSSPALSQDEPARQNHHLIGVLFKLEQMRDDAVAQKRKAASIIAKAELLVTRARQEKNARAEQTAQKALAVARETKTKAEWKKARTEQAIARVRTLASRSTGDSEAGAVVTEYSGTVQYFSKRLSQTIPISDGRAGFLEPGDEIWTSGESNVHLKSLDGRAGLSLGPDSRIRMEEESQGINLLKGKLYLAVDKLDDQRQWLEEKIQSYKEDLATIKDAEAREMAEAYENFLKSHNARMKQRFEVRTPSAVCAVRGTRFQIVEDEFAGTGLIVFEGAVELSAIDGHPPILVEAGYQAGVSTDGRVSKPKIIDIGNLEKWWPEE